MCTARRLIFSKTLIFWSTGHDKSIKLYPYKNKSDNFEYMKREQSMLLWIRKTNGAFYLYISVAAELTITIGHDFSGCVREVRVQLIVIFYV